MRRKPQHVVKFVVLGTCCVLLYLQILNGKGSRKAESAAVLSGEQIRKYIENAEAENRIRIRHVEEVCYKYNLGLYKHSSQQSNIIHPPTPQYSVFYFDRVNKISWCPIYKAASTTWLYNLCLLGGYSDEQLLQRKRQISDIAREIYPELDFTEAEEAFQTTLKLIVVRHPFERILSAYRDKLENSQIGREHGTLHFYNTYGQRIVSRYRKGGNKTDIRDVLKPSQRFWDPSKPEPVGTEPTFEEFIRYLLETDLTTHADDHWIPYYLYCTPCLLKYDIIGKVETMMQDQVYTIWSAGLEQKIQPRWMHRSSNNYKDKITKIYFSQLSLQQIKQLYQLYKLDFELFDYSVDPYFKYATSEN